MNAIATGYKGLMTTVQLGLDFVFLLAVVMIALYCSVYVMLG